MTYINPRRVIRIEGRELTENVSADIISVSVEDHATDADMATVTVSNKDNRWVDSTLFEKGNTMEILLGYGRALKLVFKGMIVRPELSFPEDGVPTLNVRAYDASHLMRRDQEKKMTTWQNVTDSQLVRGIAEKYSFKDEDLAIEETKDVLPYVAQGNETDWEFLKSRAVRVGFELFVELDEFHFHRPKDYVKRIPGAFEYGSNLKSFEPRLTTINQVSKVIVKGWNAEEKVPIVAVATSESTLDRSILGGAPASRFVKEDFGEGARILHDLVPRTQKEAEELAKAYFKQKEYELIEATGSCIGDVNLNAKSLVVIEGVGRRFSGLYYLTKVTHTMDDGGYVCEFDCKRNAVSVSEEEGLRPAEEFAQLGYAV